jgi:hypothetical protein
VSFVVRKWSHVSVQTLLSPYSSYTFSFPDQEATSGGPVASALLVRSSDAKELVDDKGKPVIR